jgi:hypothetical protein
VIINLKGHDQCKKCIWHINTSAPDFLKTYFCNSKKIWK